MCAIAVFVAGVFPSSRCASEGCARPSSSRRVSARRHMYTYSLQVHSSLRECGGPEQSRAFFAAAGISSCSASKASFALAVRTLASAGPSIRGLCHPCSTAYDRYPQRQSESQPQHETVGRGCYSLWRQAITSSSIVRTHLPRARIHQEIVSAGDEEAPSTPCWSAISINSRFKSAGHLSGIVSAGISKCPFFDFDCLLGHYVAQTLEWPPVARYVPQSLRVVAYPRHSSHMTLIRRCSLAFNSASDVSQESSVFS